MFVFDTGLQTNPRYIVNFPTKNHWRNNSRIEDIEAGLDALATEVRQRGIRSSLGGLDWTGVRKRIERALGGLRNPEGV